jgi:HSP20 family protein
MLATTRNHGSALAPTTGAPANRLSTLFERLLDADRFLGPLMNAPSWSAMPLTMWDDEQNVHLEIDAPGFTEKDIDISVHEGSLIIRGERKNERSDAGYDTRTYGRFEQQIVLPCSVDAERVEAKLANGVLTLMCPKSEASKPRKIAIKSEQ